MAGFSMILFLLSMFAFLLAAAGLSLLNYGMDGAFIAHVRSRGRREGRWLGLIPFYGQVLLGELAGSKLLGLLVAVCHGLLLGAFMLPLFRIGTPDQRFFLICAFAVLGFVLKTVLVYKLFARMNPDHKNLYTIISVLTLGFARSAMVFGMRKDFPAEEIYQKR